MSLRPLYLEPGIAWQVKLDAGVALHVAAPGRTRVLVPLSRLARVVCDARASWETGALLACLAAGVPVTFHDARGSAVAWCFGPRRRETTLASLLRLGLDHPEWPERYPLWRAAVARREIEAALNTARLPARACDGAAARAALCNHHRERLGRPAGALLRALQQATAGLAAEALEHIVCDPQLLAYPRPGLNLVAELAGLLEWRIHRLIARTPAARLADTRLGRLAAALVESNDGPLHRACGEILGDLEFNLREWLL